MKREYDEDGLCAVCHYPRHSFYRYALGWLAWYFVCKPWPITAMNNGVPPLLAAAGDCIFDCRSSCHVVRG